MSFYVNSSYDFTQLAIAHTHSQGIAETMEHTPSSVENEM